MTDSTQAHKNPPIHLLESFQARVEEICAAEGATLNEFVNVAVAEKLAHYRHLEWLRQRKTPTDAALAEVLRTLRDGVQPNASLPDSCPEEAASEPVLVHKG